MEERFEEFWNERYKGIIESGQPQALINAWRDVAYSAFEAGFKASYMPEDSHELDWQPIEISVYDPENYKD